MKIVIELPVDNEEDQIIIKSRNMTEDLMKLISDFKMKQEMLICYDHEEIHRIHPSDVYYFESVDNKTFVYAENLVLESKLKLYQIEEQYTGSDFFRASKSLILNLRRIKTLTPAFSGRFEATLFNGEKVIISRQYVADLKKKLGL